MTGLRTDVAGDARVALSLRADLPTGTVTFVFTDIEGSTKLLRELGTASWGEVLTQHAAIFRATVRDHEGVIVRTEGDSFFLAFRSARQAVAAAADAQRALARQKWAHGANVRVRIGMHTGENAVPGTPENAADYVGYDVHHAARVAAAGHGGQVVVSSATRMLLGDQLPEGVTLRDLGRHRLKDLSEPDELFQLVIEGLQTDFAPLRTLSSVANNLPVQLTTFIGRRKELADARALLERSRLLTLVGPGGTGKSRISLELAAQVLDRFPDGVWFVRLAALTTPELVASAVAQALGLVVPPGRRPIDHVIDQLKDKEALLVLDNFEQIVSAATDVARILGDCPRTKILVTTRIVLRISGEQEYPVPPLELPAAGAAPDVDALSRSESVRLFIERARAARPDFMLTTENARAIAGIVAQLDGLPLAIELAAARTKILPPQAILERLASGLGILQSSARDLPARQQTLHGAIAWSYDLLDPGLRRLFHRLSVFRGGAALPEIERVCGPAGEIDREVLDGIGELVDQSLLRHFATGPEPRFVMLETIREFAREKLDESGEASEIDLRHARAYLALAEAAALELTGARQKELLDRLDREHGNLRVALDICTQPQCADRTSCDCAADDHVVDDARVEVSLRLAGALWRFWQMRGHLAEGRERTDRILSLPRAASHREAHLRALEAAGGIAYWQGDMTAVEKSYTLRLDAARAIGDRLEIANALYDLSFVYVLPGKDPERASRMLDEALASFRAAGDRAGVAKTLWIISTTYENNDEWSRAANVLEEVVDTFRALGDRFGLGWAMHSLGVARVRLGQIDAARAAFIEGFELFRAAGDLSGIVLFFYDLAELAAAQREDDRALRLFGAGQVLKDRTGTQLADYLREENRPFNVEVRALLERTDPDRLKTLVAEGAAMSLDEASRYALASGPEPAPS